MVRWASPPVKVKSVMFVNKKHSSTFFEERGRGPEKEKGADDVEEVVEHRTVVKG